MILGVGRLCFWGIADKLFADFYMYMPFMKFVVLLLHELDYDLIFTHAPTHVYCKDCMSKIYS
jgi:hypothetical protein